MLLASAPFFVFLLLNTVILHYNGCCLLLNVNSSPSFQRQTGKTNMLQRNKEGIWKEYGYMYHLLCSFTATRKKPSDQAHPTEKYQHATSPQTTLLYQQKPPPPHPLYVKSISSLMDFLTFNKSVVFQLSNLLKRSHSATASVKACASPASNASSKFYIVDKSTPLESKGKATYRYPKSGHTFKNLHSLVSANDTSIC